MRIVVAGLILLCSVSGWAADKFQPLNVKVGLWETTMSIKASGAPPIPDDALAKLTPEQRAKLEERMKANQQTANTRTHKACVTKEDLEKGPNFGQSRNECTQTIITSTSSKLEMRFDCHGQEMNGNGTLTFEALNPENVKGSAEGTVNGGGHTMKTYTTFVSKWIGPDCSKNKE